MLVWLGSVCGAMEGGMVWDCGSGMDTMREAGWMDGWMLFLLLQDAECESS